MTRMRFTAAVLLGLGILAGAPVALKARGEARATLPRPTALAHRLWAIMDLVRDRHPQPPARPKMVRAAVRALAKAANGPVPDDLDRRAELLTTRAQFTAFFEELWPKGAGAPAAESLEAAVLDGTFAAIPGSAEFVPADLAKVIASQSANRYVGIGVQIRIHPEQKLAQIVSPVSGGPAHRAGIAPGDLIVEVDGKSTRGASIGKVVEWLRGDEGTTFLMVVRTPGAEKARTLKMTRTVVPFESIFGYRRVAGDGWEFRLDPRGPVAYLRLSSFLSSTPHELRQLERRLRDEGARALVLDVRLGGGSELHNGTLVTSALLDGQLMWSLRGRDEQPLACRAGHECLFRDWPMAVLINDSVDTVQGAFVAALQDNGRAVVVGEPTRVGGLVRSMLPLPDDQGSLALLTGRLERAAKDRTWPVQPDHVVALTKEQRANVQEWLSAKQRMEKPGSPADLPPRDPQLDKAVELLRTALRKTDEAR